MVNVDAIGRVNWCDAPTRYPVMKVMKLGPDRVKAQGGCNTEGVGKAKEDVAPLALMQSLAPPQWKTQRER